jgi:hypothetical protein
MMQAAWARRALALVWGATGHTRRRLSDRHYDLNGLP